MIKNLFRAFFHILRRTSIYWGIGQSNRYFIQYTHSFTLRVSKRVLFSLLHKNYTLNIYLYALLLQAEIKVSL